MISTDFSTISQISQKFTSFNKIDKFARSGNFDNLEDEKLSKLHVRQVHTS